MKKLLATILMVAACGTASAAEFNVSGQYGLMTDKDYGQHLAGVQMAVDDIYKGVGVYGEVGKINGGNVPEGINSNKRYRGVGLTYKATDNLVFYTGISQAKYSGKVEAYYVKQVIEGKEMKLKKHRADSFKETDVEVGMRYKVYKDLTLGLGYNAAPKAVFGTIGYTFK